MRGLARALAVFLCARSASAQAQDAVAQPAPQPTTVMAALNWVRLPGAESCLSPQALARATEARVGRRVFVSLSDASMSIEGRVERTRAPDGWRAIIRAARGAGEIGTREVRVSSPDCAAIDDRITVVIALLLDLASSPEANPQSANSNTNNSSNNNGNNGNNGNANNAENPPPRVVVRTVVERVMVEPAFLRADAVLLSAHAGVWGAWAPSVSYGAGIGVRWPAARPVALDVGASGYVAPSINDSVGTLAGAAFRAGVALSPPSHRWFSVTPSLVAGLAQSLGAARSTVLPWVLLDVRASATVAVSTVWAVGFSGGVGVPLYGPRWVVSAPFLLLPAEVAALPALSGSFEFSLIRAL